MTGTDLRMSSVMLAGKVSAQQTRRQRETKLVICVWHPFSDWRPKPICCAETIRARLPEMRVLHLAELRPPCRQELPDTDIFVGYSLRAGTAC